jgi:glycosyltransferase involved in cell wall biosynthesis
LNQNEPLVSICIPTYNRVALLKRSIESALNQDYKNIEIIVSDNASPDETESLCMTYCNKEKKLKYFRHSINYGPSANFSEVLKRASGEFFMWLGDDDWIDPTYVSTCIQQLIRDPTIYLVSGIPKYYGKGKKLYDGKVFNLLAETWWLRVISFYWQVADNGMFYGLMRTAQIRQVTIPNTMGGDWLIVANIISRGKAKTLPEISVHRELGGATVSYEKIAVSLGIPKIQAMLPIFTVAISAWKDILINRAGYEVYPFFWRFLLGNIVFFTILTKTVIGHMRATIRIIKRFAKVIEVAAVSR